jgi:hypothetical protein
LYEELKMPQNYANAFNCKKCPGTNDETGCPQWVEYVETNVTTQEVRVEKGCAGQLFPKMMLHVLAASNRPAEEISAMRSAVVDTLNGMGQVIVGRIGIAMGSDIETRRLEN